MFIAVTIITRFNNMDYLVKIQPAQIPLNRQYWTGVNTLRKHVLVRQSNTAEIKVNGFNVSVRTVRRIMQRLEDLCKTS